jgi:predicted GH43/DUF377 family glycosyl hydrolase
MKPNEIFVRNKTNPLITPDKLPFESDAVFNPGAVILNDETVLLLRIEDRRGVSQIHTARSKNGVDHWEVEGEPLLKADIPEHPYEEWGCEDARVTQIGPELWLIAYTAYSRYGPAVSLASTRDFCSVKRLGVVLPPVNKDATIFPQQFDNQWILLHRPVTGGMEHIWYASGATDLKHWSGPGILMPERSGPWWDGLRIGCGAPPIRVDGGWLLIFHGAKEMGGRPVYRLGGALLEPDNPRRVVARASEWLFAPEAQYETQGLVPGVVFTCGTVTRGDEVWMYYGAADTVIGLAVAKTERLIDFVYKNDYLCKRGREKGMVS